MKKIMREANFTLFSTNEESSKRPSAAVALKRLSDSQLARRTFFCCCLSLSFSSHSASISAVAAL